MNLSRFSRLITTEVILFFVLWFAYGLTINSSNLQEYVLQQAGVEAIAERHHFYVEGLSNWPVRGDIFGYNGHAYSNKQPGQAMIGAVAYSFLRLVGFSYEKNRLLAAALVTFFTASLFTALAGVAVFCLARDFDEWQSKFWPIATAIAFGLGTTTFAYSGIAHHDTIASAYLVIAFYLIFTLSRDPAFSPRMQMARAALAGLLLGLTITTSMLLFFMVLVIGIYFLSLRQWKLVAPFVISGIAGVVPLLIYDAENFGNPFLVAAVANYRFTGYDPEAFFRPEWNNFIDKINVYTDFVTHYAPVLWLGLLGLYFVTSKYHREKLFVAAAIIALFFYVANIQGLGTCAYGPRYLLPLMPFAALGIVGLRRLPSTSLKNLAGVSVLAVGAFSIAVNLAGALQGTMYCNLARYAFPDYVTAIMRGQMRSYPLFRWLLPLAVAVCLLPLLKWLAAKFALPRTRVQLSS